MYALEIWISILQVRSDNPFEDWRPAGAAIIVDLLSRIQRSALPPIHFLLKLEWDHLGHCFAYDSRVSILEVINVEDNYDIPYNQKYIVATSTKIRV